MKKLLSCLCALLILAPVSACSKINEDVSKDPIKEEITDPNKDKVETPEEEKEEEKPVEEPKEEAPVEKPVEPVAPPVEQPEAKPEVKPEVEPEAQGIDIAALTAQIKETDLFARSHDFDASNVADMYSGLSTTELAEFVVMKNPMSPGGDEVAIFKANEGQVETVLAAVAARDAYGKSEGAFYGLEKEMFDNSVTIQSGNYVFYIAARNVDEIANLVNAIIK